MTSAKDNLPKFELVSGDLAKLRSGTLVLGAFADGSLPAASALVDQAAGGRLGRLLQRGDLGERAGALLWLDEPAGVAAERLLVVGLGAPGKLDAPAYRAALQAAASALAEGTAEAAATTLAEVPVPGRDRNWRLQEATRLLADGAYRFAAPRAQSPPARGARRIALWTAAAAGDAGAQAVRRGTAVAEGMALAKDLGNLPGNVCHPPYLAEVARALGQEFHFEVEVLGREEMRQLGMGAALAVGQASAQPCQFIVMHHRRGNHAQPLVLVGKGVTFDTGGISLKPGANMDEMKFDMCGAASVLGAMHTAGRLQLPLNLVAIVPAVENMPGGNAARPGDVVRSLSGQTIEILNTDAEGRLGLADALTYAARFQPACVIDVATLTGACVIALGKLTSGLFANDDALAEQLLASAEASGDRAWRLPLFDEYQELLKSNFADMSNLGGREAGAITAACFLQRFAGDTPWAHFDIAGTNAVSGAAKGATGRPVPLLADFLLARAAAAAQAARERAPTTRAA